MIGQISLSDADTQHEWAGCGPCICRDCLLWWSGRCPYGGCYDDWRAKVNPYDKAHPDKPPRTWWSRWNEPGEQAHWCRGGTCYSTGLCEHYVPYEKPRVESCLEALVTIWKDGYMQCSALDLLGCEECYRRFEERIEASP